METIGSGSFGIVKKIDDDTCAKIYYKDIYKFYKSADFTDLDQYIDILLSVKKPNTINEQEMYENNNKKLELLMQMGLIQKILNYRGYKLGVIMKYYKGFLDLYDASLILNKALIEIILKKIRKQLDIFISNNIFISDLSSSNILVNPDTLDIAFIDLDDIFTRYETDEYLMEKPLVKKRLLSDCNSRFKVISDSLLS